MNSNHNTKRRSDFDDISGRQIAVCVGFDASLLTEIEQARTTLKEPSRNQLIRTLVRAGLEALHASQG